MENLSGWVCTYDAESSRVSVTGYGFGKGYAACTEEADRLCKNGGHVFGYLVKSMYEV